MPVRTSVTFKTDRFNTTEVRAYFINPCCFGDDCAGWLAEELRRAGIGEVAEPWQEDWGWQTSVVGARAHYLVSVGLLEDDLLWHVSVDQRRPLLDRLRGRRADDGLSSVVRAVHEALTRAPDIRDVRWESPGDAGGGDPLSGAADPFA